jgi:hypothetical protein
VADWAKAVRGNSAIERNPMNTKDKSENALVFIVLLGMFLRLLMTPSFIWTPFATKTV